MTNLSIAKTYDFLIVEQLYNYIIESYLNGNYTQVSTILHELNDITLFIDWLDLQNFCKPLSLLNCYFTN